MDEAAVGLITGLTFTDSAGLTRESVMPKMSDLGPNLLTIVERFEQIRADGAFKLTCILECILLVVLAEWRFKRLTNSAR